MQLVVTILVLYLLYKLIFDFIVPVSKTASQVKRQFTHMNNVQQEMFRQQQNNTPKKPPQKQKQPGSTTTTDGEYIDFEELK